MVGELAQEPRHEHGVTRVVELELVDADEPVGRERVDGLPEAERPDEVGVLDERPERRALSRRGDGVRERGQQVGLADAEPAVEVHGLGLRAALLPPRRGRRPRDRLRRAAQACHRRRLAAVRRVRHVGLERRGREVGRRDELGDEAGRVDRGHARGERQRWAGGLEVRHEGPEYVHDMVGTASTCRRARLTIRSRTPRTSEPV